MLQKGKLKNSLVDKMIGFKGVVTDVDPTLLPEGLLSEATNVTVTNQATLSSIASPLLIGQLTDPIISIFTWKRDVSGTNLIMVQAGTKLYSYDGTSFTLRKTFTTSEKLAYSGGFFDKLYIMHHTDGFFSFDGTSFIAVQEAPRSKYLLLWQTYLFGSGDLYENKKTVPTDYTYAPQRVRWSGIVDNKFESWYATSTDGSGETVNNFIDMRSEDSSNITGMAVWNRRIIIFQESRIQEIVGQKPTNFIVNTIYQGRLTTIDNNVDYYDYVYYLSPEGLCILAAQDILISKALKKYWGTANYYGLAVYNSKVYFNNGDSIGEYDTQTKFFEHYSYANTSCLYSDKNNLWLGTSDGKVYKWGQGTGILPWSFKTRAIHYGSLEAYKRPIILRIMHKMTSATITVKIILDGTSYTVGTLDMSKGTSDEFILSYPLFQQAQIQLEGTEAVEIIGFELISKIRGVGNV
jgi:hypothetical protein